MLWRTFIKVKVMVYGGSFLLRNSPTNPLPYRGGLSQLTSFVHYRTLHTSNEYFLFMKEIDERSSDKTWSNFLTTITNWSAFLSVYGYRMHLTLLSKVLPQLWLDELNELWWHLNRHLLISELLHKSSMLRKTFGLQKRHTNHYIMWG